VDYNIKETALSTKSNKVRYMRKPNIKEQKVKKSKEKSKNQEKK